MRKKLIGVGILATAAFFIAVSVSALRQTRNAEARTQFVKPLSVTVDQLPADDGKIPVELRREKAFLGANNVLEDYSVELKNNTNKEMIACSVLIHIMTTDQGGKNSKSILRQTVDTRIHPDLVDMHPKSSSIPPNGTIGMDSGGPTTLGDNETITGVKFEIDYAEFADKTSVGKNLGGSEWIENRRRGAAAYRDWLAQKYKETGGSDAAIANIIRQRSIPSELQDTLGEALPGALTYHRHLFRHYEHHGKSALDKYLGR